MDKELLINILVTLGYAAAIVTVCSVAYWALCLASRATKAHPTAQMVADLTQKNEQLRVMVVERDQRLYEEKQKHESFHASLLAELGTLKSIFADYFEVSHTIQDETVYKLKPSAIFRTKDLVTQETREQAENFKRTAALLTDLHPQWLAYDLDPGKGALTAIRILVDGYKQSEKVSPKTEFRCTHCYGTGTSGVTFEKQPISCERCMGTGLRP